MLKSTIKTITKLFEEAEDKRRRMRGAEKR
jgi:hypothetical protein